MYGVCQAFVVAAHVFLYIVTSIDLIKSGVSPKSEPGVLLWGYVFFVCTACLGGLKGTPTYLLIDGTDGWKIWKMEYVDERFPCPIIIWEKGCW